MKVLHLGKYDGEVGGIERYLRALLGAMPPDIEVINLVASDQSMTDEHRRYGYRTVRVASYGTVASVAVAPAMPLVARRLHRENSFDIVHLHFPDPLGQLTAMALPRDVRRVITWHSDIVKQKWALAAYSPSMRAFVHDVDAIIGATPQHFSTSQQIPEGKPGQRREVIPYGFNASWLASSNESRFKHRELRAQQADRGLIFSVGRHVYYKGFAVLIRAMQHVDADLIIGGRGPLTGELQRLTGKLGLERQVSFAGFIPDHLLVAYYDACDVFCMPSVERAEQFGLVQLEAMHCAKPVVATRLGTGVEFVTIDQETGMLVPPKDEHALATALTTLLSDEALRIRLGQAGKRRLQQVFSVDQMVRKTVDVYRTVCRGPSP